ncbi:hypothetical protein V6N11_029478 [Hibiscus sabdariffa]|uniref:Leucine-rich repeat-containing N-terminal plant-type domain-containing protein n=1 Tax=Hibiscus sabdariffa TaxID=183260 RepID=A0ABR2P6T3_9ROSI
MDKSILKINCIVHISFLLCIVVGITLVSKSFKLGMAMGNETDRLALLALKDQLVGSSHAGLLSWNASLHFCEWQGVRCGRQKQRVIGLSLPGMKLGGSISPSIGNLSFLREANLYDNSLQGNISSEFEQLRRLRSLNLSQNNLQGNIPMELGNCSNLVFLNLSYNSLSGEIPSQFGDHMKNLIKLSVASNDLDTVANLSAQLEALYMGGNQISGSIPQGIGNLYKLTDVYLGANFLTGKLPVSIGQLQNLGQFDLSLNNLTGEIPSSIGNLSRLVYLYLNGNNFQGMIPLTLRECKDMEELDLSLNKLGGTVSDQLVAAFQSLITLNLSHNSFNGSFPSGISNSKNLVELYVDNNNFSGEIPEQLGDISELRILHMQGNNFQGSIPQALGTELPKCFDETATKKRNGLWKKSIVVIIISLSLASVSVAFIAILCCRKQPRKDMIPLSMQRESLFQVSYKELVEATNGFSALNFLDSRLLEQINEQSSEGRGQNMLDCLVSFTNVGVACSVEVPVERMKIENVVTELHAIKARLLIWNSYKEPAD